MGPGPSFQRNFQTKYETPIIPSSSYFCTDLIFCKVLNPAGLGDTEGNGFLKYNIPDHSKLFRVFIEGLGVSKDKIKEVKNVA
jgi:hypothetical protein